MCIRDRRSIVGGTPSGKFPRGNLGLAPRRVNPPPLSLTRKSKVGPERGLHITPVPDEEISCCTRQGLKPGGRLKTHAPDEEIRC